MNTNLFIVNATATKHGGALTILNEFVSTVSKKNENSEYIIFSGANLNEFPSERVKIKKITTNGFGIGGIKRLIWDIVGLRFYCKFHNLNPNGIISFQNTGVFFPKVRQIIYYHQIIPLLNYKWKFYKRHETSLFFYKYFYPLFIRLFLNDNCEVIVQQEFIKRLFLRKFKIDPKRIHVIVPSINLNASLKIKPIDLDKDSFHIFYPANCAIYKNHNVLYEALAIIKKSHPQVFKRIKLHLTKDMIREDSLAVNISDRLNFLGKITYDEVLSFYSSVNLLVFPSYIETFGLPLLEAASFGLPVIASDLEYAHEALSGYHGAMFIKFDDPEAWAKAILTSMINRNKFVPFKFKSPSRTWEEMLKIVESTF